MSQPKMKDQKDQISQKGSRKNSESRGQGAQQSKKSAESELGSSQKGGGQMKHNQSTEHESQSHKQKEHA